jgi:hypothetical protein
MSLGKDDVNSDGRESLVYKLMSLGDNDSKSNGHGIGDGDSEGHIKSNSYSYR